MKVLSRTFWNLGVPGGASGRLLHWAMDEGSWDSCQETGRWSISCSGREGDPKQAPGANAALLTEMRRSCGSGLKHWKRRWGKGLSPQFDVPWEPPRAALKAVENSIRTEATKEKWKEELRGLVQELLKLPTKEWQAATIAAWTREVCKVMLVSGQKKFWRRSKETPRISWISSCRNSGHGAHGQWTSCWWLEWPLNSRGRLHMRRRVQSFGRCSTRWSGPRGDSVLSLWSEKPTGREVASAEVSMTQMMTGMSLSQADGWKTGKSWDTHSGRRTGSGILRVSTQAWGWAQKKVLMNRCLPDNIKEDPDQEDNGGGFVSNIVIYLALAPLCVKYSTFVLF